MEENVRVRSAKFVQLHCDWPKSMFGFYGCIDSSGSSVQRISWRFLQNCSAVSSEQKVKK